MKIVEHCDSISEVPILTVALFWSARQGKISDSIISKIRY